jgi:hypothetical protein
VQAFDPWNLQKLSQGMSTSSIKPCSMSLLVRVRLPEFEGWKEDPSDFKLVNKMFLPGSGVGSFVISNENYFNLVE